MRHIVRLIAASLFAVLFISASHAAVISLVPKTGISRPVTQGGTWTANAGDGVTSIANIHNGRINDTLRGQIQGRGVEVGASWGLAHTAAETIGSMLFRGGVIGTLGIAAAGWLANSGLEYINGQLQNKGATVPPGQTGQCATKNIAQCNFSPSTYNPTSGIYYASSCSLYGGAECCAVNIQAINDGAQTSTGCGYPEAATSSGPATAQDAAKLNGQTVPDAAANEFRAKGVPLPLTNPQVSTTPIDVPISEPYTDPVTGKRYRDMARITPGANGEEATVTIYKQEVDAQGDPLTDSNGQPIKEEDTDPCQKNPDAAGCKPLDEVPDENLQTKTINLSVIPLPGFGPDSASCPAPQNLFSAGGQQVTWSWSKFCDFSRGIRPLVLGFAWIAAIMIVVGVARREA